MTEQATVETPIPASPAAALESVTVHPEGSEAASDAKLATERARDDLGRYTAQKEARAVAEKRGEDALKKEFPDLFPKRDGSGVEQPKAGPEKAAANGSKEAKVESAGDPSPRQLGRADSILQRAKISQARIDAMSPKDRMELAKELKPLVLERQQENQRATDPNFAPKNIATPPQAGSPAGEPHDTPLSGLAESFEEVKENYGPEFAATLEKVIKSALAPYQAKEAEQAKTRVANLSKAIDASREALVDRFPELEDDDTFNEDVWPYLNGLAATGRFDLDDPKSVQKLVLKAAQSAELDEVTPQAKQDEETVSRLSKNGTASSRSKAAPYTGKTRDEKIALAAKLALDPSISVEDARRRVHGS